MAGWGRSFLCAFRVPDHRHPVRFEAVGEVLQKLLCAALLENLAALLRGSFLNIRGSATGFGINRSTIFSGGRIRGGRISFIGRISWWRIGGFGPLGVTWSLSVEELFI
jgi:hypothetical protein